jgi:hypothetical protein
MTNKTASITSEVFTDPATFARTWLKIIDKSNALKPLRYNAAQSHYMQNRTSRDLILKARQLGFSTMIQAEMFRLATTGTVRTLTLSHKDESTQAFRRVTKRFYDNLPETLRPARRYDNASLATYPDFDSEAVIATAGGKGAGRSMTFSHQHWSEVAYWTNAEDLVASALQAGTPQWIIAESTPNGAQGWFYERCMEAIDGASIWVLHFYPWWWEREYKIPLDDGEAIEYTDTEFDLVHRHNLAPEQIKWRRFKHAELRGVSGSQNLFAQEYPEDPTTCFIHSGASYFGDLSRNFDAPMQPVYNPDHRYYAGLDFGQTNDYTVCTVIDTEARCQIETIRMNRLPWGEMRRRVRILCEKWSVKTLVPEANSMGTTNIEELSQEFKDHDMHVNISPFTTTNSSKAEIAADWHEALHGGSWQMQPIPERQSEYRSFVSSLTPQGARTLAATSGAHDDIIIADMLAYYARSKNKWWVI